ncbi:MAG TPA: thioredoxin domain-containing protein [Candidatus Binataceae bacterium]|nr:thioredoxin domain-containing protein [Candidatus Binataceae bacterium]
MNQHPSDPHGRKPNRLANEQSPYLRQHAYNPVDWYPWGEEALKRAKAERRPILLSIGYSACHWCHVMERESFENDEIARAMNEHFVPIKVDREERPDLDQIYMDAVQLIAGRGGWPLTVFLTPEGEPFFGGTYFPPVDRQGMPGFGRVLAAIAQAWNEQPETIGKNVASMVQALQGLSAIEPSDGEPRAQLAQIAARALAGAYDSVNGGIGGAPKFPNSFVFSLFLRVVDADADLGFADMVSHTLTRMAKGGIYDQLGGGFHRYSVDDRWLVPHFEKMLYDNALLARLYLDGGRALRDPEYLTIARQILDYVLREMTSPEGGFYSSQDADSEGEEGRFFLWSVAETRALLGAELSPIAERYFDISEDGNFEGRNILHRTIDRTEAARLFHKSDDEMERALAAIVSRMFAAREQRVKPGRDDKILAAWNAMMIGAFAEGYRALGDRRYLEAARRAADFAMSRLWDGRRLHRSYKDGAARFNAYLEDYALLAGAMIDCYEATLEARYLDHARTLGAVILERFLDRERGGFYFTSDDHETLIVRSKPSFDGSTPSGNSAAAMALLRLHAYTGEERYLSEAARVIRLFAEGIGKQPFAFAHLLEAVDLYQRGAVEVVLVKGDAAAAELADWIARIGQLYLPNRAIFVAVAGADSFLPEAARGRPAVDGKLTGYVCRERSCSAPVTTLAALEAELRG